MSVHHTVINEKFDASPKRRKLKGNPKNPEAGTHIIEFPGGAIELSRLDDGTYWAHIIVNRKQALSIFEGREAAIGEVVDSRVDWEDRHNSSIPVLSDQSRLTQLAVRIRPIFPETAE